MKKIDIHVHVRFFHDEFEKKNHVTWPNDRNETYPDAQDLILLYEKLNIEKGVLLPRVSPEGMHVLTSNESIMHIVRNYPKHFDWFCNVDPRSLSNTGDSKLGHLIEYYASLGAKGIGEVICKLPFDDVRVRNLFRHAQSMSMPILFHLGGMHEPYGLYDQVGLPLLEKALADYPDLMFIGHAAAFWAEISTGVSEENRSSYNKGKVEEGRLSYLLNTYPNLHADISANSGYNAITRDVEYGYAFLERFQDKLIYGTDISAPRDFEFFALSDFLKKGVTDKKISKTAYEKIVRLNALAVLDR